MPETEINPRITERQLKLGYWFTRHRIVIKAVILSVLYLFFGILIFFNVSNIVDYYASDEIDRLDREILADNFLQNINTDRYRPSALQWQTPELIDRGDGSYDMVVEVYNPNQDFRILTLGYTFAVNDWVSDVHEVYVLPGQRRTLYVLNARDEALREAFADGVTPKLSVAYVDWKRIKDKALYTDSGRFMSLGLESLNEQVVPGQGFQDITFSIVNDSVYNYRDVEITAVVYDGVTPVGVQAIVIRNIRSQEERSVRMRLHYDVVSVTTAQVELSTDVFNEDNLLPFTLEQFE